MSWTGGKKALANEIAIRFPDDYTRYVEVFGGGGWVLFHKPPRNDFEVYNDAKQLRFCGCFATFYLGKKLPSHALPPFRRK